MADKQLASTQVSVKGGTTAILEPQVVEVEKEMTLEGWSGRVEDLVDKGDEEGAIKLLEGVIAKLSLTENAGSNLGLAAALSDLGGLYAAQGLSLKADDLLSSSLLVKKKAEEVPRVRNPSWEEVANTSESTTLNRGLRSDRRLQEGGMDYDRGHGAETPTTSGLADEDDWEAAIPSLLATPPPLKPLIKKTETSKVKEPLKQKQRGRGAFTYGGGGLYSDNVADDDAFDTRLDQVNNGGANDHWDGGAEHVLLIDGFSPMMKTKDLEDLVKPYSSQGITVRWVDDTTALAVFRTPAHAQQALAGIHDPRFKLHKYRDADAVLGRSISLSVADLEPPAPRPVTTARVAQRMIAGALSRQGINQSLRAKTKAHAEQALIQEAERKQRLHNRQQLRDEAWGDD